MSLSILFFGLYLLSSLFKTEKIIRDESKTASEIALVDFFARGRGNHCMGKGSLWRSGERRVLRF